MYRAIWRRVLYHFNRATTITVKNYFGRRLQFQSIIDTRLLQYLALTVAFYKGKRFILHGGEKRRKSTRFC